MAIPTRVKAETQVPVRRARRAGACLLAALLCAGYLGADPDGWARSARAEEIVPDDRAAVIFSKILFYETGVTAKCGLAIHTIIAYSGPRALTRAEAIRDVIEEAGRSGVDAQPMTLELVSLDQPKIVDTLRSLNPCAVYLVLDPGAEHAQLKPIADLSVEQHYFIFSSQPKLLTDFTTLSLRLVEVGGKTKLRPILHLDRANAQGCRFDPAAMRLFEVVGR